MPFGPKERTGIYRLRHHKLTAGIYLAIYQLVAKLLTVNNYRYVAALENIIFPNIAKSSNGAIAAIINWEAETWGRSSLQWLVWDGFKREQRYLLRPSTRWVMMLWLPDLDKRTHRWIKRSEIFPNKESDDAQEGKLLESLGVRNFDVWCGKKQTCDIPEASILIAPNP